jgi:tetratricopeptide (TPR) repeat protein
MKEEAAGAAEPSEAAPPEKKASGEADAPAGAEVPAEGEATPEASAGPGAGSAVETPRSGRGGGDRLIPLRKLVELAARYPEVGPPLAELSFAIGEAEIGNQLVRLGTDRETPHIEYWFVAANAARREKRYDDVIQSVLDAIRSVAARPDEALAAEDEDRLLHLVRVGFATVMFDLRQLEGDNEFARVMSEHLPQLEGRLGKSPFYRTLLAQTIWFRDREAAEREWDRAAELGDPETTWNARGTWYNEAEKDLEKAEKAYRRGLEKARGSALLMHNLAQILVEKAKRPGTAPDQAHRLLNQATEQLRLALRQDAPRLRRHIHSTRDRLEDFRRTLPTVDRRGGPPRRDRGDRGPGPRARAEGGPGRGGPGGRPPGGPYGSRPPGPHGGRPPQPRAERPKEKFLAEGKLSLGEMILAKLKEKGK